MSPGDTCSSDGSNFVVVFTEPRCSNYSGITLTFSAATIAFNSLGVPVDSGGTPIGNQTVTVTLGSSSQNITIEAGTGRVYE